MALRRQLRYSMHPRLEKAPSPGWRARGVGTHGRAAHPSPQLPAGVVCVGDWASMAARTCRMVRAPARRGQAERVPAQPPDAACAPPASLPVPIPCHAYLADVFMRAAERVLLAAYRSCSIVGARRTHMRRGCLSLTPSIAVVCRRTSQLAYALFPTGYARVRISLCVRTRRAECTQRRTAGRESRRPDRHMHKHRIRSCTGDRCPPLSLGRRT